MHAVTLYNWVTAHGYENGLWAYAEVVLTFQVNLTWLKVVHFYCFKAYFGAFIELHLCCTYITQNDFLLQVTPFLKSAHKLFTAFWTKLK